MVDVSPHSSQLRNFLRGGTSATQQQKFYTDDAKSVRNPLIGRWSSFIVLAIVYEWQTKDNRPQRSNVNVVNLQQNSQYLWNIVFSKSSIWVLLELICRWTQRFTKIDQEKCKIEQICIWKPMTTGFIMLNIDLRHQYGISVAESQTFLLVKMWFSSFLLG